MARNVMVVDDERDIRITVRAVLEPRGFKVLLIESGEKCIEELEKGFKGVILLDIMMAGMDGWETVREITKRGLQQGNIIAMLTAKHDPDPDLEQLAENVLHYIRKPFEPSELVAIVGEYCQFLEDAKSEQGTR
ncbi:MAG: response regulator [Chloroflexi bacterium]|nr:response regulator [Chloroflexota bacterium]